MRTVVASEITRPIITLYTHRHLVRRWMCRVFGSEFRVLAFILDQTIWCKTYERVFPLSFIEKGDWDTGPEETRTGGVGIGQKQLRRIIKSLEAQGLINVDRTDMQGGLLIALNLYTLYGDNPETMPTEVIAAYERDALASGVDPRLALPGRPPARI